MITAALLPGFALLMLSTGGFAAGMYQERNASPGDRFFTTCCIGAAVCGVLCVLQGIAIMGVNK